MMDLVYNMALETIRDLLLNVGFFSGVSGEVEEIQTELKTIHNFLKDADARPDRYDSNTVRTWVDDLRKLALDAEDVLETYAIEVTSKREEQNMIAKLRSFARKLSEGLNIHRVGKDIRNIRSRMADLTTRLESIMAKGESSSNPVDDQTLQLRQTYGHQVEEHFVGMEKDIEQLLLLVSNVDRSKRVISIHGMGGLGKTTLARKIYQNEEVKGIFKARRAWVCVSQQFNAKSVLQQILKQLAPDEGNGQIANMEIVELVPKLYNVLKRKKCFVVIDDIWKSDDWNILKPAFPIEHVNCKILLTARNERIAGEECPYKLDCLTEDQGWELLQKIASLKNHSQGLMSDELRHHQLETIGREMVKKCGCLPLAVSVIGGSLRHKQTLSEWEKVNENIDVYLKHGEGVGKDKRVEQVLDLSYNTLPYYLKPCFLYLGCFPEDQEIDAERLYLLWMAEGMIYKGNRETLRDVAERYLSELAFRCMVQVKVPEYSSGHQKFESCRLHDLMRDLCLSKGEKEGFLKVIDFKEATDRVSSPIGDIPRLAFHLDVGYNFADINLNEREKLRSLLTLRKVENRWSAMVLDRETNFNRFKFLRILILDFCEFEDGRSLLSEVGKLLHLRYLSLLDCINVGEELPRSIYSLPYLHTLNLAIWDDDSLLKLPNMIFKMKRLRHLFLGCSCESMDGEKLRLDGLNELETLTGFDSELACTADIPKLTNLRTLVATIKDKESLLIIANHISNNERQQLRETTLEIDMSYLSLVEESLLRKLFMCHSLVNLEFNGPIGCNLPCYEPGFCKNLLELSLEGSEIEEDVMETLGKFPMLKSLDLHMGACMATEMICHANAFPQLKSLILRGLSNLEKWRVDKGAMPNLSKLQIDRCLKLEMIPSGLQHITTLQELSTCNMPKEFEDRLQVVNGVKGQDYDKVCHIPSISLYVTVRD